MVTTSADVTQAPPPDQDFYEFIGWLDETGQWPPDEPFPPGYEEHRDSSPPPPQPPQMPPEQQPPPSGGYGGGTGPVGPSGPVGPPTGPVGPSGPAQPPQSGGGLGSYLPDMSGILDVGARIRDGVSAVVGVAFQGVTAVIGSLRQTIGALIDYTLPTVAELALGVANAAQTALDFIGDNLTDAADLGASLAEGIASPFSLLLEAGGSMLWEALARLLSMAADAFGAMVSDLFASVTLERAI